MQTYKLKQIIKKGFSRPDPLGIALIVFFVLIIIFTGCTGFETKNAMQNTPTVPNIHWMRDANQMTCITPQDTVLLFQYMQYMEVKVNDKGKMPKD